MLMSLLWMCLVWAWYTIYVTYTVSKILTVAAISALVVFVIATSRKDFTSEIQGAATGDDESTSLPSRLKRQRQRTEAVEKELAYICEYIIRDFVEYWYDDMTDDQEFGHNIRWLLEQLVYVLMSRVLRVNWSRLVNGKIASCLSEMLLIYNAACSREALGKLKDLKPGSPERIACISSTLMKKYTFHTAVYHQEPYLRDFSTALIGGLLQPIDFNCNAFRSIIREILTTKVLASVAAYGDPYWVNFGLSCLPDPDVKPDPDAPPYVGPGGIRSEEQKQADEALERRLQIWAEEKNRRMEDMEALIEGTFELNSVANEVSFDAIWDVKIDGIKRLFQPKPFVVYVLRVVNGEYMWHVNKRYSEFKQLHAALKKSFPGLSVKLPAQHIFSNNMDPKFIHKRKHGLQIYIQQLVWDRRVADSRQFLEFLVDRRQKIKATRTGNRKVMQAQRRRMIVTRQLRPSRDAKTGLIRQPSNLSVTGGGESALQPEGPTTSTRKKEAKKKSGKSKSGKFVSDTSTFKKIFKVPSLWGKRKKSPKKRRAFKTLPTETNLGSARNNNHNKNHAEGMGMNPVHSPVAGVVMKAGKRSSSMAISISNSKKKASSSSSSSSSSS
eukprot:CAMPEP_0197524088 /NCGR_PEP_ID=MMETSP1318-20131121/8846_1 /TAXON_ID=552666 /ORGANISM="Partenskyella glossopodia, Strain RCC365" /LENGTH=610 /DNA_ID=CAMNT_0043076949 /DNA_START=55 /DNA_END=1884 /DNA_ORIENTATION=+